jgi:hypothetical protein
MKAKPPATIAARTALNLSSRCCSCRSGGSIQEAEGLVWSGINPPPYVIERTQASSMSLTAKVREDVVQKPAQ